MNSQIYGLVLTTKRFCNTRLFIVYFPNLILINPIVECYSHEYDAYYFYQ